MGWEQRAKVGDKIVCIKVPRRTMLGHTGEIFTNDSPLLELGRIYTIEMMMVAPNQQVGFLLVEIPVGTQRGPNGELVVNMYLHPLFRPVQHKSSEKEVEKLKALLGRVDA